MSGGVKESKLAAREATDAERHTPPHEESSPQKGSFTTTNNRAALSGSV